MLRFTRPTPASSRNASSNPATWLRRNARSTRSQ
jgi:hypothetical protein